MKGWKYLKNIDKINMLLERLTKGNKEQTHISFHNIKSKRRKFIADTTEMRQIIKWNNYAHTLDSLDKTD